MTEPEFEELVEHPLFPTEDDEEPAIVQSIYVKRKNPATGEWEWFARPFAANELTELSQIAEMWGGGKYELKARGPDEAGHPNARLSATANYTIPGPPKPFFEQPSDGKRSSAGGASDPMGGFTLGAPQGILAMMMGMMQMNQAAALKQSEQTTQILLALLQNGRGDADKLVTAMQAMNQHHSEQMAKLYATMLEAKGGSGGTLEQALDAIKTGIELKAGASGEGEGGPAAGSGTESLMEAVGVGLELLKATGPGTGAPPAGVPNAAA